VCLQEGVKTENDHINLKVAGQDGSVVQFKIKRHTPLSKLMKAYCERQVRPPRALAPVPLTMSRGSATAAGAQLLQALLSWKCVRVHECAHECTWA